MLCSKCGGEIDLSSGRCTRCGEKPDELSGVRLSRSVDALAEQYHLEERQQEEREEDVPELMRGTFRRKRKQIEDDVDDGPAGEPTLGLDNYLELLGDQPENEEAADDENARQAKTPFSESGPGFIGRFLEGDSRVAAVYRKFDALIAPTAERVLKIYREKFPQPKRVQHSPISERIALMGAALLVFVLLIVGISSIVSSIAPGVKGEWLIRETSAGEKLTWEFTGSGDVYVHAYIGDESYIYQSGTYKKQRKNDHNLLIVTYEDGKATRLYYELDGDSGTFTNVDSNRSAVYHKIK